MAHEQQWVWVLYWQDKGKGFGVLRTYSDETRAEEDRDLCAAENPSRTYTIEELPVYHGEHSAKR